MRHQSSLARRRLIALGAAATASSSASAKEGPGLLVASPPGARMDGWAELLSVAVGRALPTQSPLEISNVGGLDGVTGANTFQARGEPDGKLALLVPGAATISWLVGDTRARFDPARWLPLWAATNTAALVSRAPLARGSTIRVAASSPGGVELPMLLALDLMGVRAILSPQQGADAMMVQGADLRSGLRRAADQGMVPVLSLGLPDAEGELLRDPLLPTVPTAVEAARGQAPPRISSVLQAVSLAAQLDASLILPALTPAASVAAWRRACVPVLHDADLLAEAARVQAHMLAPSGAAAFLGRIAGDADTLLALRRWLATRYDYSPT